MGCTETIIENGRAIYRDCHTHRPIGEQAEQPAGGPGTELKKILAAWPFRIKSSSNCSCNAKARTMDAKGCDWCADNIDTIVSWLREEAGKRKLPFVDAAGRLLVKRAIYLARRNSNH
jgi:hypothetical protein